MENCDQYRLKIVILFLFISASLLLTAQVSEPKGTDKVLKASEKLNLNAQKLNEKTTGINNNVQNAGSNLKTTVDNVKAVIRVFEPILRMHLKKKKGNLKTDQAVIEPASPDIAAGSDGTAITNALAGASDSSVVNEEISYSSIESGAEVYSESPEYNTDGTANLGNQNNRNFGCYIDIMQGRIMDDIDVAGFSSTVDLIFTATDYYGSAPMYALLTPAYVKNDNFSNYYFRGPLYKDANIPVRQWEEVNESEVALTSLTGLQFDKIQNNNQLMAVVKSIPGFKDKYESRTKMEGKVFAVKTEMGNRTAYGLIHVVNQYGTTGANGYLKIKLKVTGFDANNDGNPDTGLYIH